MQRKKFIKVSSGLGAGLLVSNAFARNIFINYSEEQVDHLIIGSGYGGAVAALRLTQAGKKVVLLEMGLDWEKDNGQFKPFSNLIIPKNNSTWLRKHTVAPMMNISPFNHRFTGVLDRIDFQNIKIYAGRGVGGGSLVNGGMAVHPKKEYFKEMLPELDADQFWNKYFPLAYKELEVNKISDTYFTKSNYYKFARVGESEAHKAGFETIRVPNVYSFNYMEKEEKGIVPKSALAKEVIYGNNHGKKSLEKTYLKKAVKTGLLTILDLHKVTYFEETPHGFKVYVDTLNPSGEITSTKINSAGNSS